MARYNEKRISYPKQDQLIDLLCIILSDLKTKEAIKYFLKDLLNRKERIMLIRRLFIAEMLTDNIGYREIKKRLRCGCTTIAKVERLLNFGRGGYKKAVVIKKRS